MNVWMGILTLHETEKNGEALYFFRQAPRFTLGGGTVPYPALC